MSLVLVTAENIKAAEAQLSNVKLLTSYLVDSVELKFEKQSLDPLFEAEMSFAKTESLVNREATNAILTAEAYCDLNTKRLREEAHKVVGYSPDLVDDIVKPIKKAVKQIVSDALLPISTAIGTVQTAVTGAVSAAKNSINTIVLGVQAVLKNAISFSETVVKSAVSAVKTEVTNILDEVSKIGESLGFIVDKLVAGLAGFIKPLLTFEIEDILNLQTQLTEVYATQEVARLKSKIGAK